MKPISVESGSLVPVGKIVDGTFAYINLSERGILSFHVERASFTDLFETGYRRSKDSTCRSMETGYLPVTFCEKISSAAEFVRALGIMWKDSSEFRSLRGWLLCIGFQRKSIHFSIAIG